MIKPKDIKRLHKRLEEQPEEPGAPLLDLIVEWRGPTWLNGTWEYYRADDWRDRKPVDDLAMLEAHLLELNALRAEIEAEVRGKKIRAKGLADKDEQIAYIQARINFLRKPPAPPRHRGRPRGKASGHLSPVVERRNGKTYPVVPGERVPKDLAYDYPEQFNWLYQWGEWCDRREKWITKSKRVPYRMVHTVRWHIGQGHAVQGVLADINRNSALPAPGYAQKNRSNDENFPSV